MSKHARTWLKRCTIALVLGALTTVGVAWGLGVLHPERPLLPHIQHSMFAYGDAASEGTADNQWHVGPDKYALVIRMFETDFQHGTMWRSWDYSLCCGSGSSQQQNLSGLDGYTRWHADNLSSETRRAWGEGARLIRTLNRHRDVWQSSAFRSTLDANVNHVFNPSSTSINDDDVSEVLRDTPLANLRIIGYECARGWPMPALSNRFVWSTPIASPGSSSIHVRSGIPLDIPRLPTSLGARRALPLRPIWPGFLADTAFYAAGWLSLIQLGALAVRRFRRGRGDGCPHCGYDLAGLTSPVCPECATIIK